MIWCPQFLSMTREWNGWYGYRFTEERFYICDNFLFSRKCKIITPITRVFR